jgi:protein SCO1/2
MSCQCCQPGAQTRLPAVGGYFLLDDHDGRRVDAFSFGDRLMLLFFGFTNCAVVCPRELAKFDAALDQLGDDADAIQPLYVTIDPERDSPAALRAYLGDRPRFRGLTGTQAEIDAVKKSFRVFAERRDDPQAPDGYVVPHTSIAYLAAPGGQVIAHFPDALTADELASRLRTLLHERRRQALTADRPSVAMTPGPA